MELLIAQEVYGYCELVETIRFEGGEVVLGGYSKRYTKDGILVETTENVDNVVLYAD